MVPQHERRSNQTISTVKASDITIVDHSEGLMLEFFPPSNSGMVVKDFQKDATGKIAFLTPVTFTSDGHGGTMATALGISVDFQGFKDIAALEGRVVPAT
jgi:hypothetical protein